MSAYRRNRGGDDDDASVFDWGAAVPVDTGGRDRGVWLVKIPPTLARAWSDVLEGKGPGDQVLGRLRVEANPAAQMPQQARLPPGRAPPPKKMTLFAELPDLDEAGMGSPPPQGPHAGTQAAGDAGTLPIHPGADVPAVRRTKTEEFDVSYAKPEMPMVVFHEKDLPADPARERIPPKGVPKVPDFTLAAAGKVEYSCQAVPRRFTPRSVAALVGRGAAPKRSRIQLAGDPMRTSIGVTAESASGVATKREIIRRKPGKQTLPRLPKQELVDELFRLFETSPKIHLNEIQATTRQPVAWLRDVLSDIATKIKRGPNSGLWELKPEYRIHRAE
jgi:TFIIF, beta subunit HTH domain/TFIIF, beta subunit N-terminus